MGGSRGVSGDHRAVESARAAPAAVGSPREYGRAVSRVPRVESASRRRNLTARRKAHSAASWAHEPVTPILGVGLGLCFVRRTRVLGSAGFGAAPPGRQAVLGASAATQSRRILFSSDVSGKT